jgi:hypothetical protein
MSRGLGLLLLLLLASPAWAGNVRCQTHHEPTLNRLQTLCDDGTRSTLTWSPTLQRWETTVTPPPGKACAANRVTTLFTSVGNEADRVGPT